MAKQSIDIGAAPNDGTGDPLRTWATKSNENFDELYRKPFSPPSGDYDAEEGDKIFNYEQRDISFPDSSIATLPILVKAEVGNPTLSTRAGGDSIELAVVPLGESVEFFPVTGQGWRKA